MTSRSHLRQYGRAIRHFGSGRALEVAVLQASPLLGAVIGGVGTRSLDTIRFVLLLTGSFALTAHVFVFNDWAGRSSDLHDPRRAPRVFGRFGIGSRQVAVLAVALLVMATAALSLVGVPAVLLGAAIAALSILYSCSPIYGKGTPIAASLIHLLGGALHFMLGYTVAHPIDTRGVAIATFFGLVFAGGHLNQEVRDHDADLRNGIRTNAVVFGCRRTLLGSLSVFTAAYATLAGLASATVLPRSLLWGVILWPMQAVWSLQALRGGSRFETALWLQRRYRFLFAVLGLAILITAMPLFAMARREPEPARRRAIIASLGEIAQRTARASSAARHPQKFPPVP